MPKVPLIARRSFLYAGKRFAAGAEFDARGQQDARFLIAIGHADFAPAGQPPSVDDTVFVYQHPAPNASPAFAPSPMVEVHAEPDHPAADPAPVADEQPPAPLAEQPADDGEAAVRAKPRRQYRRRDMNAEGSE